MTWKSSLNVRAADPLPKPKPDIIDPVAPPEQPVQPTPVEDPAGQPLEVPGRPGGGDIDQPGRVPDEVPPDQL